MPQMVMSRTQRRAEKKQAVLIVVLVVAVAVASFALGFAMGKRQGSMPGVVKGEDKRRLPMASRPVPVPPPEVKTEAAEADKLTFYDNLPKGNQAPLGTGINLPPEQATLPAIKPEPQAAAPVVEPVATTVQPSELPAPTPSGGFVVQAASFRTEEDARKLIARLAQLKMVATIERADLGEKGVWYRVLAGPYVDRDAANLVATRLQEEERLSALVKQR